MMLFGESFDPQKHLADLTGRVAIVTGGNSGIGYTAIKHLARRGAKVYMAARNQAKANAAIVRLTAEGLGAGEVHHLDLDLSDPCLARAAAKGFFDKEGHLDILINNAAQILIPFRKTLWDIQDVVLVNYFSTVAFTHALLPLMEKTAQQPGTDVRIVNVTSGSIGVLRDGNRFRNREDFNRDFATSLTPRFARYGLSKLVLTIWTKELQRRLIASDVPIVVIAADPGCVHTDGNRAHANTHSFPLSHILNFFSYVTFKSADKGCYTSIFSAASPHVHKDLQAYSGAFINPSRKIARAPNKDLENEDLAKELWQTTQELLTEFGAWTSSI